MQGENIVVLNSFELGDEMESENAMKLPLRLAVALLKDINGKIDLNLKVSGDLDDPSFSISGIIMKVFANLITKAVTAPFKLLGSLVPGGGGEEIGYIEFEAGSAELLPPEKEKLDQLVAALGQRPNLSLKIPAGYNERYDTRALQELAVAAKIAEQLEGTDQDDTELLTRRTLKALEKQARAELDDFDKSAFRAEFEVEDPETGKESLDEVAYMAAMRVALADVQEIPEADLVTLAEARQQTAIRYITANQSISPTRILPTDLADAEGRDERWVNMKLDLEVDDSLPTETAASPDNPPTADNTDTISAADSSIEDVAEPVEAETP